MTTAAKQVQLATKLDTEGQGRCVKIKKLKNLIWFGLAEVRRRTLLER